MDLRAAKERLIDWVLLSDMTGRQSQLDQPIHLHNSWATGQGRSICIQSGAGAFINRRQRLAAAAASAA